MSRREAEVWAFFGWMALAILVVDAVILENAFALDEQPRPQGVRAKGFANPKDEMTRAEAGAVILSAAATGFIILILLAIRKVMGWQACVEQSHWRSDF